MKKPSFVALKALLSTYFICYLIAALCQSTLWGDLLSPLGGYLSCFLLLSVYRRSRRRADRMIWLLCGLACLFWALADTVWAVIDLGMGINPTDHLPTSILYTCTNLFFVLAVTLYSARAFRKWHGIKMILNVVTVSAACLYSFWVLLFQRNPDVFSGTPQHASLVILCTLMDFGILISVANWHLFAHTAHIAAIHPLRSIGLSVFALNDLCYNYTYVNQSYVPNSVTDAVYIGAYLLIAAAGIGSLYRRGTGRHFPDHVIQMPRLAHKGFLLLLFPVLMALAGVLQPVDILIFGLLVVFYEWFSAIIRKSNKKETLLHPTLKVNLIPEEETAVPPHESAEKKPHSKKPDLH